MDFLLDLQNQWIIGIIAFFILSLLFGMAFGTKADWSFTLGWVVCGIFALIFITQAFPDVWNYVFWLVGIYFLSAVGMFSFLIFQDIYGNIIGFLGFVAEIAAISIGFLLILHLKNIRDEISGIIEGKTSQAKLFQEGRYVPLGLWALAIMGFWLCCNLSIWGWFAWADSGTWIGLYFIMELIILFLGLYILWVPQTSFRWKAAAREASTLSRPFQAIILPKMPKTRLKSEHQRISACPACGRGLVTEKRTCPNCSFVHDFYWCPRSEIFVKRCDNCSEPVSFSARTCPNCKKELSPEFTCTKCDQRSRIRYWKKL